MLCTNIDICFCSSFNKFYTVEKEYMYNKNSENFETCFYFYNLMRNVLFLYLSKK